MYASFTPLSYIGHICKGENITIPFIDTENWAMIKTDVEEE